jgi:hypothetical protein
MSLQSKRRAPPVIVAKRQAAVSPKKSPTAQLNGRVRVS